MTSEQLRAATSEFDLCYVKAGPGSGKTYLATEAFGYLRFVRYRDDPRGVVGVTFARSARSELETRILRRWGARSTRWPNTVSTFDELHRRLVRYLVHHGHLGWPGGRVPERPNDTWRLYPGTSAAPGKKRPRFMLTIDDEGLLTMQRTTNPALAPVPCFVDEAAFRAALGAGHCTHVDIRNVLRAALDEERFPRFNDAVRTSLRGSYCHLIVDEAFDMNVLDALVVERAIEAGLTLTVVGDPWQSLYEFRGSAPATVHEMIGRHRFDSVDMPGTLRYRTEDMKTLAHQLFHEEPFEVGSPRADDDFDVVLAHDWNTLWDESRIAVLPAGKPSRLDGGPLAACFVLLINEVVREQFGVEVVGVAEARHAVDPDEHASVLDTPLSVLRDPASSADDVWAALRDSFQPEGVTWPPPGKRAGQYMKRLKQLSEEDDPLGLGLSVHQAKGLEWDSVLFIDAQLTSAEGRAIVLDQKKGSHRAIYVALTRARSVLRVMPPSAVDKYGAPVEPVRHVPAPLRIPGQTPVAFSGRDHASRRWPGG